MDAKDIKEIICKEYNISIDDMFNKSRKMTFVEPRALFFWVLRNKLDMLYTHIAKISGYTHGTIISHVRRIEGQMQYDKAFRNKIKAILSKLHFGD